MNLVLIEERCLDYVDENINYIEFYEERYELNIDEE